MRSLKLATAAFAFAVPAYAQDADDYDTQQAETGVGAEEQAEPADVE